MVINVLTPRSSGVWLVALMVIAALEVALVHADTGTKSPVTKLLLKEAEQGEEIGLEETPAHERRMPSECRLFAETTGEITVERADILADLIAEKLGAEDGNTLRARADVARLGLFGLPRNTGQALSLYIKAATTENSPSPEAAYNAALMLYRKTKGRPGTKVAKNILGLLKTSGLLDLENSIPVAGQAHYIAASLYANGNLGKKDPTRAFLHYRASADSRFLRGMYQYLLRLSRAMLEMSPDERSPHDKTLRVLTRRYRWSSLDLLRLTAEVYQVGLIPDPEHFRAPYYGLILAKWQGGSDGGRLQRASTGDDDNRERIEEAAARIMRTVPKPPVPPEPQFAEMCMKGD